VIDYLTYFYLSITLILKDPTFSLSFPMKKPNEICSLISTHNTDPIAQWMCEQYFSHLYKTKQQIPINLTSLIFETQTYLNLTKRSLSETGRARSQFQSGWIKLPLLNFFYLLTTSRNLQSASIHHLSSMKTICMVATSGRLSLLPKNCAQPCAYLHKYFFSSEISASFP
jgi:hypothetical protein